MSTTCWVTVHCDAPGCLQWTDGGNTAREARAHAAAPKRNTYGPKPWGRVRDGRKLLDLCPTHLALKYGEPPADT